MTTKPRILVTSAAGRNASTAVLELLRKGFPVRAFVRRNDARSERLREAAEQKELLLLPQGQQGSDPKGLKETA